MDRWVGKVALVTGASAGIGYAIAEKLVEAGIQVVGVARRMERLENLAKKLSSAKGKFYAFPGDVSKEEDILKAFKWTKENVGPVSILVNNAGIVLISPLSESPTSHWEDTLKVNVLAPCIAAREAIKQMKEDNIDGHIVNINSIAGHKVIQFPKLNLYPASKHAVTALTETLRLELSSSGSKIKVTSLSPGSTVTEILGFDANNPEDLEKLKQIPVLEAADVADAVLYVLSTPKHVNVSELTIQPVGEKM